MKRILVAIDCSEHSLRAAEYVAELAPGVKDCSVVIFSVLTGIPYGQVDAVAVRPPEVHGGEDHLQEVQEVRFSVEEAVTRLKSSGLSEDRLEVRFKPESRGIARDILDEALGSGCDTVVVGRRGLSPIRSLLQGSVSREVVQGAEGLTVWVVG